MKHSALTHPPSPATTTAEVNIHLRARAQDRNLIDRAADLVGANRSQFMLASALNAAKNVLIDQSTILADAKAFQQVMDWMDRPATRAETAGMTRLRDAQAPWRRD
jgi:uncharacterized protein (DUF1778 family)